MPTYEIVRGKKVQISPDNYDTLVIPSARKNCKVVYFTKVSTQHCTCPGFYYCGCCKHLSISNNVRLQREEKLGNIASDRLGDVGDIIAQYI